MTMDSEMNIYTVNDYLINKVKFDMPMKALLGIMHDRELENGIDIEAKMGETDYQVAFSLVL